MQPNDEQVKEFWEWCGFKLIPRFGGTDMTNTLWRYPEDNVFADLPPIDLNSLFKYAVPKLLHYDVVLESGSGSGLYMVMTKKITEEPKYTANEDPALAFFWAIREVMMGVR